MSGSLERIFHEYGIKPEHQVSIGNYLRLLRARDMETYRHSVRVGLMAAKIATECGIEGISPKVLLWAGLLHDIGKALVDPRLFKKGLIFTETEYREMEPHAEYGWRMLRNVHEYTANIVVRHHRFGSRPYPAELPPLPEYLLSKKEIIETSARLLALADYYDAITRRKNEKFGRELSSGEKREKYLKDNADRRDLVLHLEQKGVFQFST